MNDFFETSEEELKKQKEEEILLAEEDRETGTIKNSKIKIDEFFDRKKVLILVLSLGVLILVSLYFANQMKKNKKAEEEKKTESISTGTGLNINDEISQIQTSEIPPQNIPVTEQSNNTVPTSTPDLSQYDSQLGSDYSEESTDFGYDTPTFSETENTPSETENLPSKESDWRKSSIGFNKETVKNSQESDQNLFQQQSLIQPQPQPQPEQEDMDQNKQKSKLLFLKQKQDGFYSTNTTNPSIGRYELKTGMFIPAVLVTAINSDLPGDVIAQVRENVYDYRTGKYILIPMGTKIIGKYDSNITYGQNRVLLIWQRLVFPNGSTLTLDNMQGVDLLGNAGLKGKTNNHFWKLMRSVLLSSAINIASGSLENLDVNIEAGSRSRVSIGTGTSDAAQNIQSIGERLVEKDLNRQPTIEIKRGHKFNIFVSKDVMMSPYRIR